MDKLIDSKYIQFSGQEKQPWNRRLLSGKNNIPAEIDTRKQYIEQFENDCCNKNIELLTRDTCYCGSQELELIATTDRFGMKFSCNICRACGLLSTSPYISPSSLKNYYQKYYHKINLGRDSLHGSRTLFRLGQGEKIYKFVQGVLPPKTKLKVLEVGFGTGNVLSEFKKAAALDGVLVDELGTEFSLECLEKARQSGLNVMEGSLKEVASGGLKFDLIILSHVFEHFVDIGDELTCLEKLMGEESIAYIEVPGIMSLHKKNEYNYDFLNYFTHAHTFHFNLTSLTDACNRNGFMLVKGNEEIEAVFKLGRQRVETAFNSHGLLTYLHFLENVKADIAELNRRANQAETLLKKKDSQLRSTRERLCAIQKTWSWKLTAPLRKLSSRLMSNM